MDEEDLPPLTTAERRPSWGDWIALTVMLALGHLAIFLNQEFDQEFFASRLGGAWDHLALVLLLAPVVLRRMAPVVVGLYVGIGFGVFRVLEVPEGTVSAIALFLAIHAVGAYGPTPAVRNGVRAIALLAGAVALAVALLQEAEAVSFDSAVVFAFTIGLNIAFYAVAWLLGDAARTQRITQAQLARRADELAVEREKVAAQAVTEERVRIARELHDVVAHHVSVMGVQAAAARHVLDRDPGRAAEAMLHVEESGRQAVEELQRLVAILRSEVEDGVRLPQPTLDDLDRLVEGSRQAGLQVVVRRIGRARPVPSAVALSTYRIVQEALTNVRRHASGASATVVLTYLAESLQVEVVNTAAVGGTPAGPGGGRGLLGMRERVGLLGGTLDVARLSGGGFRVSAEVPALPARAATPA